MTSEATFAAAHTLQSTKEGTSAYYRALAAFCRSQTFRTEDGRPDRDAIDRRRLNIASRALVDAKYKRTLAEARRCVREASESIGRTDEELIAAFRAENLALAERYEAQAAEIEAREGTAS